MSTCILYITHKNVKYLVSFFFKDAILLRLRISYDLHTAMRFVTWCGCCMRFCSSQTGAVQNKHEQRFQHPYVRIL